MNIGEIDLKGALPVDCMSKGEVISFGGGNAAALKIAGEMLAFKSNPNIGLGAVMNKPQSRSL